MQQPKPSPTDVTADLPHPPPLEQAVTCDGAPPPPPGATAATAHFAVQPQTPGTASLGLGDLGEVGQAGGLVSLPGYTILGELGRGGMGVVYQAMQKGLNRLVALKMILGGADVSADRLARFRLEAEAVAALQHPNIVQVYEVGEYQGLPYFSLEFVPGQSLAHLLAGQDQPPRPAAALVEQLAWAVHAAHQKGIIHRDLKPANVLVALRPGASVATLETVIPKITDFGIAKRLGDASGQTQAGEALGTPSYMAPEQAQGRLPDLGPWTDVYALGAILYELLTGRPPFRGTTVLETMALVSAVDPVAPSRVLSRGVPRDLETICLKCLEKDPRRRYPSAAALAEDLSRFLAGEPIRARPVGPVGRAVKWARRRPLAAALLGVIVAAAALVTAAGFVLAEQERRRAEDQAARAQTEAALRQEADRLRARAEAKEQEARAAAERAAASEKQAQAAYALADVERQRAERNFRRARQAVDEMLSRVAQEHLADVPGLAEERPKLLQAALAFFEEVRQEQGDTPAARLDAAQALQRVGAVNLLLGRRDQAAASYRQALALLDGLGGGLADTPAARASRAQAHFGLGEIHRGAGRLAEAEQAYRAALELGRAAAAAAPDQPAYRFELGRAWNSLARTLQAAGRRDEARAAFGQALELQAGLVAAAPGNAAYRSDLAGTLNDRAILLGELGRPAEAEHDYAEALKHLDKLREAAPHATEYRLRAAAANTNLGALLARQQQPEAAEAAFKEAVALSGPLVGAFPTVPRYRRELAANHLNLATLQTGQRTYDQAAANYQAAATILEQLVREDDTEPDYASLLAGTLDNWGNLLRRQRKFADAQAKFAQAQPLHRAALRAAPRNPAFLDFQRRHHLNVALAQLDQGDPAAAAATAKALAQAQPEDGLARKEAGVLLARCAAAAPKAGPQAEDFAAEAVRQLAEAVRLGAPNVLTDLKAKKELEVLGGRADFQKVLAEAEAKRPQ